MEGRGKPEPTTSDRPRPTARRPNSGMSYDALGLPAWSERQARPAHAATSHARGSSAVSSRGASRGESCRTEVKRSPLIARGARALEVRGPGLVIVAGEAWMAATESKRVSVMKAGLVVLQKRRRMSAPREARDLPHRRNSPSRNRSCASALSTVVQPRQRRVIMLGICAGQAACLAR